MEMKMSLLDYLGGIAMRKALMGFEDALNPFVKSKVQAHFPEDPNDAGTIAYTIAFNADLEVRKSTRDVQLVTLKQKQAQTMIALEKIHVQRQRDKKDETARDEEQALHKQKSKIEKDLSKLNSQETEDKAKTPDPRWIRECRRYLGRAMKTFVNTDNRWDVFTLVQVMRGFPPEIFSSIATFLDDFRAKEFLTSIIRVVDARNDRAHQSRVIESDALTAMSQMVQVLRLCKSDIAADNVNTILEEAKVLVDIARTSGTGTSTKTYVVSLDAREYNAQLAYVSINKFCTHINAEVGKHFFQDRGITFGNDLDSKWHSVIKSQNKNFKIIAELRHWYFHHVDGEPNIAAALTAMERVVAAIATVQTTVSPWQGPPITTNTTTPITIILNPLTNRMSIPVARERTLVGRKMSIDTVTTQLLASPCTRVLIHGNPGVGKDTVAAEVVHNGNVRQLGGLQAWLQASFDLVFRGQLIDVFRTHRPWVIQGLETDASACVEKISMFLRESGEEWLFVIEDMSSESTTAIDFISQTKGVGRVLITSQAPLYVLDPSFFSIKLEPFTTDDSVELLLSMNLFSKKVLKVSTVDDDPLYEMVLKTQVEAAASAFGCQLPKDYKRLTYTTPPANEKASATKQRQQLLRVGLREHQELTRPEFRTFLEEESGNLPLVIALYGHILRADDQITTTLQLIAHIRKIELSDVDKSGRNPTTDKHCFGLVKSVKFMLQRLKENPNFTEHEREDALALLTAMSMLDRTQTPLSLFLDHDLERITFELEKRNRFRLLRSQFNGATFKRSCEWLMKGIAVNYFSWMWISPWPCPTTSIANDEQSQISRVESGDSMSVFRERANLERARDVLCDVGILHSSTDTTKFVGVIHQLVQQCVRNQLVYENKSMSSSAHNVIYVVRQMLRHRIGPSRSPQTNHDVVPCVEAWCAVVLPIPAQCVPTPNANRIKVHADDLGVLRLLGNFIRDVQGDARTGLLIHERVCKMAKCVLPRDHPDFSASMNELASTFSHLGRHKDALNLMQEASELLERVLPPDHKDIALSKGNLAVAFSQLGRHDDALKLRENVLEFQRRELPQNHPDIATSINNLAVTFSYLGRYDDALKLYQEALAFDKRVLPPDHPHIATSMYNLAVTYSCLGRHADALELHQEALAFQKRVLPQYSHPVIAKSMNSLARTLSNLGRHADALKLYQEALEFQKRILPPDHKDIATSMNDMAAILSRLGRHADALKLHREALVFQKQILPPDHPDIATSMNNVALSLSHSGQHADALILHQEALEFWKRVRPPDHKAIGTSLNNLALSLSCFDRHTDALKLHQEALELRKRVLKPDHPEITTSMNNLAETLSHLGRHADALKLLQEVLEFQKRVLTQDHPEIATSMHNLALSLSHLGRHADALNILQAVLKFRKRVLPLDHPDIAISMNNLASIYSVLGRHDDALKLQQEVLAFMNRVLPPGHLGIATSMYSLASTFSHLGRYADALKLQQQVLEFQKRGLPQNHPDIATSMHNLAATFSHLGRHANALKLQQEALEFQKRVLPQNHPHIARSMNNLATTFSRLGQHEKALKLHQDALEFQKRELPPGHQDIALSMNNLAGTLSHLGRHADTLELLQEALEFLKRVLPPDHLDIVTTMDNLATNLSYLGRNADALKLHQEVLEFWKRVPGQDHPDFATAMCNMASTLSHLGRHDEALKLGQEMLEFRRRVLPQGHPDIAASMRDLGYTYVGLGNFEQALIYLHSAIQMCQRRQPPDNTAIAKLNESVKHIHERTKQSYRFKACIDTVCLNPTCCKPDPPRTCTRCGVAKYCDESCQISHWETHKLQCKPKRAVYVPSS